MSENPQLPSPSVSQSVKRDYLSKLKNSNIYILSYCIPRTPLKPPLFTITQCAADSQNIKLMILTTLSN